MSLRLNVRAIHSSAAVIVEIATGELRRDHELVCAETRTRYRIGGFGMIPTDAYEQGLRMVALVPVAGALANRTRLRAASLAHASTRFPSTLAQSGTP